MTNGCDLENVKNAVLLTKDRYANIAFLILWVCAQVGTVVTGMNQQQNSAQGECTLDSYDSSQNYFLAVFMMLPQAACVVQLGHESLDKGSVSAIFCSCFSSYFLVGEILSVSTSGQ